MKINLFGKEIISIKGNETKMGGVKSFSFSQLQTDAELFKQTTASEGALKQTMSAETEEGRIEPEKLRITYMTYGPIYKAINVRAAFVIAKGFKVVPYDDSPEAKNNANFCDEFCDKVGLKGLKTKQNSINTDVYGTGFSEVVWDETGDEPLDFALVNPESMDLRRNAQGEIILIEDEEDPRYGEPKGWRQKVPGLGGSQWKDIDWASIVYLTYNTIGDRWLGTSLIQPVYKDIERVVNINEGYGEAGYRTGFPRIDIKYGIPPSATDPRGVPPTTEMQEEAEGMLKGLSMNDAIIRPYYFDFNLLQPNVGRVNIMTDSFYANIVSVTGVPRHIIFGTADEANFASAKELNKFFALVLKDMQLNIKNSYELQLFPRILKLDEFNSLEENKIPRVIFDEVLEEEDQSKIEQVIKLYNPGMGASPLISKAEAREMIKDFMEIPEVEEREEPEQIPEETIEEENKVHEHDSFANLKNDSRFIQTLAEEDKIQDRLKVFYENMLSKLLPQIKQDAVLKFDWKIYNTLILNTMETLYIRGLRKGILDVKKDIKLFETPPDQDSIDFIKKYTIILAKEQTKNALEWINLSIAEGIKDGWSMDKIKRQIKTGFPEWSNKQALRVARTETQRAVNQGRLSGYEKEDVKKVEFLAAGDACPICTPLNGEIYELSKAYGKIPVHPNCRCTWIPLVK